MRVLSLRKSADKYKDKYKDKITAVCATGAPPGGELALHRTHPHHCLLSGCGDGAWGVASASATKEANEVRSHSAVRLAAANTHAQMQPS